MSIEQVGSGSGGAGASASVSASAAYGTSLISVGRIKKLIKEDTTLQTSPIQQDVAFLVAKSAELFVSWMARKALDYTRRERRKILHLKDIRKDPSDARLSRVSAPTK